MTSAKITNRDVYETLWKCRDFELSTLWQRSAMLGVFMVATYTGYGALLLNAFEHGCSVKWPLFNLLAIGVCCFGMVFSALWIMMLKGSKRWYERCEAALSGFQGEAGDSLFEDSARTNAAFGVFYSSATENALKGWKVDESLLSTSGGRFSVSRTAIAIGQVSFVGWLFLSFAHATVLEIGFLSTKALLDEYGKPFGFALLAACLAGVVVFLKDAVKSTSS